MKPDEAATAGDEKDGFPLTADDHRFIESLGLHFEDQGIPRIGGRMLGLLMLAPKPLSLGTIAELLQVSPASVSTNVRRFHAKGLVQEISYPGDRRHYYVFSDNAWEHRFDDGRGGLKEILQILNTRKERLGPEENLCLKRFTDAIEFFVFFSRMVDSALERWRARKAQPDSAESPPQSRTAS
ncbi:GbsR/MarR family transcriptional regulator [Hyalangium rubrum]|uniref:MarR family transcriptional regulator n=1 Tax=Hyalangium rubrum TaxID=3103134 RepID=A0ABU5H8U6_9BACT|nr:MarR family transcriptional regulator [Hyalangium sp. s54d21]MDY7229509.1 MarR family transcriptional regulator [Hyalangium sp. s54d21]